MTLELGIHLAWFARYQNQPFIAKISQISHFWVVDTFAPGVFCNLRMFAHHLVEYQPIHKKRIVSIIFCNLLPRYNIYCYIVQSLTTKSSMKYLGLYSFTNIFCCCNAVASFSSTVQLLLNLPIHFLHGKRFSKLRYKSQRNRNTSIVFDQYSKTVGCFLTPFRVLFGPFSDILSVCWSKVATWK